MGLLGDLVLLTVFGVLLAPIGIAIHEAGHALAALLLTRGEVLLRVGDGDELGRMAVGRRLTLSAGSRLGHGGSVLSEVPATRGHAMAIGAAGPIANAVAGGIAVWLLLRGYRDGAPHLRQLALGAFALDALVALLLNLGRDIIVEEDGHAQPTDGEQIARLAGATPLEAPQRTSPVAWVLLGVIGLIALVMAVDTGDLEIVLLGAFVGVSIARAARAERRQRAR